VGTPWQCRWHSGNALRCGKNNPHLGSPLYPAPGSALEGDLTRSWGQELAIPHPL